MRRWYKFGLLCLLLVLPLTAGAQGTEFNQAGLVLQFSDGTVATYCVEFSEPRISGHEALARVGLDLTAQYSALGAAVCKIEDDGCQYPADICFCQCNGNPCTYWAYHHLVDGAWQYSGFGASSYELRHGDVDGWAWGEGSMSFGAQPPLITFEEICGSTEAAVVDTGTSQSASVTEDQVRTGAAETELTTTASISVPPVGYAGLGIVVVALVAWLMIANGRVKKQ